MFLFRAGRRFYHFLFRLSLRARCIFSDIRFGTRREDGTGVPLPPALLRYRVSEDLNPAMFEAVGENAGAILEEALRRAGRAFEDCRVVLDFGCGCGRVLVPLASRYPHITFHGCDVDAEAIAWCRSHVPRAQFEISPVLPPSPFGDSQFDLVYCISVFTHLSDEHQRKWLPELARIIAPGGTLVLTFHGERVWRSLPADRRVQIEREGHLFEQSTKLKGVVPDWYHTSYHSRAYATGLVSHHFTVIEFVPAGFGYQDLLIATRR